MLTPEQIAERRQGLGGSDLAAALGLSRWRTPHDVWLEKTGRAEPFEGNLQTRFGSHAEEFVADEYERETGLRVHRYAPTLRHPSAPLLGHIDFLVAMPDRRDIVAVSGEIITDRGLECKTASAFATGRDSEWGESGTDAVPQQYLVQCAAYMALTGCDRWDLAVLFGNQEFRVYHLARDSELEGLLLEEAARWWRNHVIADVPPDPRTEAEARQRWVRHAPGKVAEVDDIVADSLRELASVKAEIKALEVRAQELRDAIIPAIGDADTVMRDGRQLATFRANKDSPEVDYRQLADHLLDTMPGMDADGRARLIAAYTETKPGARVLRIAKHKDML